MISKPPDDSWASLFQKFWDAMNTEYVHFFEETDLDWDDVYDEYKPKFEELDFSSSDDTITAFRYFKEIVWNIKDYHYRITFYDIYGNRLSCVPAMLQKWEEGDSGRSVMEYPDIYLNNGTITSVQYSSKSYASDEVNACREQAVKSYFEVENLTSSGAFHTITGNLDDDYKVYYSNSISKFTGEES